MDGGRNVCCEYTSLPEMKCHCFAIFTTVTVTVRLEIQNSIFSTNFI